MTRVLVVEDEPEMGMLLARGLRAEGYEVDVADNGIDALTLARENEPHLALLDVMLPGMSGFELCRHLKAASPALGIMLVTARDAVDDRVRGLDAGADDYLIKPFAFAELAARLRALQRRDVLASAGRIELGTLSIDTSRRRVTAGGTELRLSGTEFDVLRVIAEGRGATVARTDILREVWGSSRFIDQNIVDQYVSYLRKKLERSGATVRILTERGVGFRIPAD
ncbi:response regulator transcription factor [Rathayibacter sp. YIM 133350]|uniref:response regulator transcription factor n=1 Tax=Rathayibacter sp. YIM 133350 TaxID=3131992 RepID=UPI00307E1801